jgi:hypothetical protein
MTNQTGRFCDRIKSWHHSLQAAVRGVKAKRQPLSPSLYKKNKKIILLLL